MSLESRTALMRRERGAKNSDYLIVGERLKKDANALHAFFRGDQLLDPEIDEVYELTPLQAITSWRSIRFLDGFGYVAGQWYPLLNAATSASKEGLGQFLDEQHLAHMFRDRIVTTRIILDELEKDPSGTTWLERLARTDEFRGGELELAGALKAIHGAKKMYEGLTAA